MTVGGKPQTAIEVRGWGRACEMDNETFGMTVTLVGMGGTLLTLWLISLMIVLLKKIFPLTDNENVNKADR